MQNATAYCDAVHTLTELSRNEKSVIADTVSRRDYHMQALTDELKARSWVPLKGIVDGAVFYIVPRLKKIVRPFTVDDILTRATNFQTIACDDERSIRDAIVDLLTEGIVEQVPSKARITKKVSDDVAETAPLITDGLSLCKVLELEQQLKALRDPFKSQKKPLHKTRRLLEPDVMDAVGEIERGVDTPTGKYVLKRRANTQQSKFSLTDLTKVVREVTDSFLEEHSLDAQAKRQTISAISNGDFGDRLQKQISSSATEAEEPHTKLKLQCVRF